MQRNDRFRPTPYAQSWIKQGIKHVVQGIHFIQNTKQKKKPNF